MARVPLATRLRQASRSPGKLFYGWWIVIAGTFNQMVQSTLYNLGFGAFFLPIAADLHTNRTTLSGAFSLNRLESGVLGPFQGWLIDRFGIRRTMTVGFAALGAGLILVSQAHSVLLFYLAYGVSAVGAALSGFVPMSATVINWFIRKRGVALGLFMSGGSAGGLFVPVLVWSIHSFGWRPTAAGAGALIWLTAVPMLLVLRPNPETMGLAPDGARPSPATESGPRASEGFTVREALRTPAFWLIAWSHSIATMALSTVTVHQIPALVDMGLSEQVAATLVGVTAFTMVLGRFAGGYLGDLLSKRAVGTSAIVIQSFALMPFALAPSFATAVAFSLCFGIGFGARGVVVTGLRGDYFGRRGYASITGAMEPVVMIGTMVGPVFAGWTFDTTGSYRNAFLVIAAVLLVGACLLALASRPRVRGAAPASAQ